MTGSSNSIILVLIWHHAPLVALAIVDAKHTSATYSIHELFIIYF